ncbi:hypothetical protein COLO4_12951 [Corchorus olitorius]|uniref:Uncharacterized protein n=1 Tax=Corchorus olitorius TaxID=93759 RepID=A0A1R3JZ94_9ROSI|nr:hypothetical protein COLO4_12951 [Corchorus olitorius]
MCTSEIEIAGVKVKASILNSTRRPDIVIVEKNGCCFFVLELDALLFRNDDHWPSFTGLGEFLGDDNICFVGKVKNALWQELADKFAMNFGMEPQGSIDFKTKYLSDEEIKYTVHDAYRAYAIGNKLLGLIWTF